MQGQAGRLAGRLATTLAVHYLQHPWLRLFLSPVLHAGMGLRLGGAVPYTPHPLCSGSKLFRQVDRQTGRQAGIQVRRQR